MNKLKSAGVSLVFTLCLVLVAVVMLGLIALLLKLCTEHGPVFGGIVVFIGLWAGIHHTLKEDGVIQ